MFDLARISEQTKRVIDEFIMLIPMNCGHIVVIGCSTSEVIGTRIGSNSSMQVAQIIMNKIYPAFKDRNIFLAVQCCEHLNRALVVEKACAEQYNLNEVMVIPHPKGGGLLQLLLWIYLTKLW